MPAPAGGASPELEAALARFIRANRLAGAAAGVVYRDQLTWSAGAGFADLAADRAANSATLYRIASITKTFTGTAVMQLRDAGLLHLDEPAATYLPEMRELALPKAEIEAVTLRRMLAHESGLASEPPGTDWTIPVYEGIAARTLQQAGGISIRTPPSQHPKYSNLAYQLLGEIVARVSGIPYDKYVQERILTPLGMAETTFDPVPDDMRGQRATGYAPRAFSDELDTASAMPPLWAEGGLWSCVDDLGRWLSFHLQAYREAAVQSPVLAAVSLREMHLPRYLDGQDWSQAWCLAWAAERRDSVTWIQHSGGLPGFSTNVCFDPEHEVGAIALINGSGDAGALAMDLAAIARRDVRARPPVITAPAPTPPPLRPLLGLYSRAAHSEFIRVEWRDGRLTVIDPETPSWHPTLLPTENPRAFVVGPGYRQSGEPVVFHELPDGRIDSVFLADASWHRLEHITPFGQPGHE